jgi:small subunit ribosomal protein S1
MAGSRVRVWLGQERQRFVRGRVRDPLETKEVVQLRMTNDARNVRLEPGQIREGIVLGLGERGATIDLGVEQRAFAPKSDLAQLEADYSYRPARGQPVAARIVEPRRSDGRILVSLVAVPLDRDWDKARQLKENGRLWKGRVTGYRPSGLVVQFRRLDGFMPASQFRAGDWDRLSRDQRQRVLEAYVNHRLPFKVVEVEPDQDRLIFSEKLAWRELRRRAMDGLLESLSAGDVVQGRVSRLRKFGAFVNLGGAEGLIHVSELAWRRVKHPGEVVELGEAVRAMVLKIDRGRRQIALSLKELEGDPWQHLKKTCRVGQLVTGTVTNVVDFGAFVSLDRFQVDGLLHISELDHDKVQNPRNHVRRGDRLLLRVIRIDADRKRIGLSRKEVRPSELEDWRDHRLPGLD